MQENTNTTDSQGPAVNTTSKNKIPDAKSMLAAGVHFGHESQKWNPKMKEYIYGVKNNIHIIDIVKTEEKLQEAVEFLAAAAKKGNILFVGTKRQASEIVKQAAVDSSSFFITHRWPGGLLTNFKLVQKSIKKLNQLESEFEMGVVNRTKYEVTQMKKEWERMSRIYEGVKTMERFPTAIVVVDSKYERLAINEAKALNIPVIAIVDTNCNPFDVNYPIPANDDAIKSIALIINSLADAVNNSNEGKGVKHIFKDYSKVEIKVLKVETQVVEKKEEAIGINPAEVKIKAPSMKKTGKSKGILEDIQSNKTKKIVKDSKTVKADKK